MSELFNISGQFGDRKISKLPNQFNIDASLKSQEVSFHKILTEQLKGIHDLDPAEQDNVVIQKFNPIINELLAQFDQDKPFQDPRGSTLIS